MCHAAHNCLRYYSKLKIYCPQSSDSTILRAIAQYTIRDNAESFAYCSKVYCYFVLQSTPCLLYTSVIYTHSLHMYTKHSIHRYV